jgi:hypothetical protein
VKDRGRDNGADRDSRTVWNGETTISGDTESGHLPTGQQADEDLQDAM